MLAMNTLSFQMGHTQAIRSTQANVLANRGMDYDPSPKLYHAR
jgi:hypothetical protein